VKLVLPLILFFNVCFGLNAQIADDFSDGDCTSNPVWIGQQSMFRVNADYQLQSDFPSAGSAYLSLPAAIEGAVSWEFFIRLAFSPSANNFARIYLMSDTSDVSVPLHGYFIQLGEAGSLDAINLFRQDSVSAIKILSGKPGHVAKSSNSLRIRVSRNDTGFWKIESDTLGGSNFSHEASGTERKYSTGRYFGVLCTLTSSNSAKVSFDDLKITKPFNDTISPILTKIIPKSEYSLQLDFNEPLDTQQIRHIGRFMLNNVDTPQSLYFLSASQILMTFKNAFTANVKNTLAINGIADPSGNFLPASLQDFTWVVYPNSGLIISELMPDPDPVNGLPDAEFVEVNNSNSIPLPLSGWKISDSISIASFPPDTISPGQYAIICSARDTAKFSSFGKVIPVGVLPTLNNNSDILLIYNKDGVLVDKATFNLSWYHSASRQGGGWSLEKIFLPDTCRKSDNWSASVNPLGGSPGSINSIYSDIPDSLSPELVNYTVLDASHILLQFNESIVPTGFICTLNNSPSDSIYFSQENKVLFLVFKRGLIANDSNIVFISGIRDCNDNLSAPVSINLNYFQPEEPILHDIIFNEIMPDPDPVVSDLPDAEYIELYNRSSKIVNTAGWELLSGNRHYSLPAFEFHPGTYLVLCANNYASLFTPFGPTLGLTSFPALNNAGMALALVSDKGMLLDYLEYYPAMHTDSFRKSGGWSLEREDTSALCTINGNWTSCSDLKGGTPAQINSVAVRINDNTPPQPILLSVEDSLTLHLYFSEPCDSISLLDPDNYSLNHSLQIIKIDPIFPSYKEVQLKLSYPINSTLSYILRIKNISDCLQNKSEVKDFRFALPLLPDSNDIILNEILFNPSPGGVDFVEAFNPTNKTFDLRNIYLANADESGNIKDFYPVTDHGYLFFPGDYVVFTSNPSLVSSYYFTPSPEKLLQCQMPSFNDDNGTVILMRHDGKMLDKVSYLDKWHFNLISNTEGVSLERINPYVPSSDAASWHSASSTVGYATPTYINSQYSISGYHKSKGLVALDTAVFSPDNDGFQDVLHIHYIFPLPGNTASVSVYNANGFLVRQIANNTLLSTSGYLQWDGLEDNGAKAPIGIYILIFEYVNPDGSHETFKLSCTLTTRL
jgi:hypothetical protein